MEYIYDTEVLRDYSKKEGTSFQNMAKRIGVSNTSFARYVSMERLPNIDILMLICNRLGISVSHFIHPKEGIVPPLRIYPKEKFIPVRFMHERIEVLRMDAGLSKQMFVNKIEDMTGVAVSMPTYERIISGSSFGHEFIIALLNTFDTPLDFLFNDAQLTSLKQGADEDVKISVSTLREMQETIRSIEEDNRRLRTENNRMKRKELDAEETCIMDNQKLNRRIRSVVRRMQSMVDELNSYLPEYSGKEQPTLYEMSKGYPSMNVADNHSDDTGGEYSSRQV